MGKLIDLTNQRFGFWMVISLSEKNKSGQTQWLCQCDCGTQKLITANSLRIGNSTSCGCNHKPNLVGEKFGKLTVIKLENAKDRRYWLCQCECGNETITTTYKLRGGHLTSCYDCKSNASPTINKNTLNKEIVVPGKEIFLQNISIIEKNISILQQQAETVVKYNQELQKA
jgi:hypothetical protein